MGARGLESIGPGLLPIGNIPSQGHQPHLHSEEYFFNAIIIC